jgi:predicted nucleic acid-binding Zn finger protein
LHTFFLCVCGGAIIQILPKKQKTCAHFRGVQFSFDSGFLEKLAVAKTELP